MIKRIHRWLGSMLPSSGILSDTAIKEAIKKGTIRIAPFDPQALGSNSYDVHLGEKVAVYENGLNDEVFEIICGAKPYDEIIMQHYKKCRRESHLDAGQHNKIRYFSIPKEGLVFYDDVFYLGVTDEYTETHAHVPFLEGKSSTGRLGVDIHATAGKGDVGFCGNWTLEISVKQPVKLYSGMPIGQLIYFPVEGEVCVKYNQKENAKYSQQPNKPIESMMWKNKFFKVDFSNKV